MPVISLMHDTVKANMEASAADRIPEEELLAQMSYVPRIAE